MTTSTSDDQLEALDRELLNAVQWDFPLEPRPFAVLGERLGITEEAVRERVARVKELGVLRQLSAIFDTRALGYHSSLVAARIDPDRVDDAAAVISAHPGVSHNYKRNHAFNLWYTIAVPPDDSLDEIAAGWSRFDRRKYIRQSRWISTDRAVLHGRHPTVAF